MPLQLKLLRVLQEQEFERLGSGRPHRIDVRVVAAAHRDLAEMVRRNEFRSDLYYRPNVFPVVLPPLRERRQDIGLLVSHFVEMFGRKMPVCSKNGVVELFKNNLSNCELTSQVRKRR